MSRVTITTGMTKYRGTLLRRCPFCDGGKLYVHRIEDPCVVCQHCCSICFAPTMAEAVRRWNGTSEVSR